MTILADSNIFYYIILTLAEKATPANTITLYIGNREIQNTTVNVVAALKEISGIGNELSGNIPALTAGRVVIDNTPGLFGGNRRFSDYLEKYAIVNQDIKIYYNALYTQDFHLNALSGATLLWQDLIFNVAFDDKNCSIALRSDLISNLPATAKLDSSYTTNIISSAVGKVVPVVLGSNQFVKPICIEATYDLGQLSASLKYAYGTNYGDYKTSDITTAYAKHRNGYYVPVELDVASPLYGDGSSPSSSNQKLPTDIGGQAWEITAASGIVLTAGILHIYKHSSGAPAEEEITFGVWSKHPDRAKPDKLLGSGGPIVMSDLSNGWNSIPRVFDNFVVIEAGETFYFGFFTDTQDDGTVNRAEYYHDTVTYNTKKYKMQSGTAEITGRWKGGQQSPNRNYRMALYALDITGQSSTTTNSAGMAVKYATIAAPYRTGMESYLQSLDLIFKVSGIKDDVSGTITGSASSVISQPQHIGKLLSLAWNGSTWTGGNFDSSTYSGTHTNHSSSSANYYRVVGGVTTGSIQRNRLLAAIGQELQVFFARVNATNNFAMYSLGSGSTSAAQITDKDIISLRALFGDRSGVVTIAKASYYKDLTRPDFISTISQGGENNYSNFYELRYDDNGLGETISADSATLYGENELARKTYEWLSDETSVRNVLKAILGFNQHPPVFVEIEVPLLKFVSLKLFDTVQLITPQLPMFEGANTRHSPPIYDTDEQVLADTDNETFLGYGYKASIVSIKYDLMQTALPIINLRLRLILNEFDPT